MGEIYGNKQWRKNGGTDKYLGTSYILANKDKFEPR